MIQIVICTYIPVALILGIYFSFRIINVNILIISETVSAALVSIPIIFIILKEIGFSLGGFNIKGIIRDIKLGFPLVISYVVDTVLAVSDRYLLALFLTVTDIGYYNPGYAVGSLIIFVPKAFGMVLPQFLSRSVDTGREEEARTMLNYALKGFLLLAIPFIVGASALSKPLLNLLGNEVVAQKAFLVTPFVATGMLFYGLYIILSNILFVRMKTRAMLRMNAIVAFLSLTLNCILLYFFRSILMTAITALISFFVVFILMLRVVKNEWRVDFDVRAILKSVISALVMGGVLYWMAQAEVFGAHRLLNILGNIVIGITVYLSMLFSLKTFSQKELFFIRRLFG
ncbi:MAG: polysaccharide biosynthesis C-terminal domain-containing protein [Candidatus Marinimicrobia bacterium]|nr:polysaccharide biosynthesis C-terminal domain-containing protein [Candidatus Neomarinimicrobiota bacterium]